MIVCSVTLLVINGSSLNISPVEESSRRGLGNDGITEKE